MNGLPGTKGTHGALGKKGLKVKVKYIKFFQTLEGDAHEFLTIEYSISWDSDLPVFNWKFLIGRRREDVLPFCVNELLF